MATHGTVARNERMTLDVAAERTFPAARLGHTFEGMPMADGRTDWLIRSGSEMVGGILALSGDEMSGVPDGWFTTIEVDGGDARLAGVAAAGGSVVRPPFDVPGVGRIAVVRRPGGAHVGWMTSARGVRPAAAVRAGRTAAQARSTGGDAAFTALPRGPAGPTSSRVGGRLLPPPSFPKRQPKTRGCSMRVSAAVLALAIAPLAMPAAAQTLDIPAGTYAVDNTHLSVLWRVKHLGFSNYTGQFDPGQIDATIELDPEDIANSTLSVTIPVAAVLTNFPGEQDFDAEIAGEMFLDGANHPNITFVSNEIEVTGENTATITGDMTIKGVTQPVTLDVVLNGAGNHPFTGSPAFGISATGTLNRSDFGVTHLLGPVVADPVEIIIEGEFVQAGG